MDHQVIGIVDCSQLQCHRKQHDNQITVKRNVGYGMVGYGMMGYGMVGYGMFNGLAGLFLAV